MGEEGGWQREWSDEEMDQECPDFSQIKNSPMSSPAQSPRSARENSVILEARDVGLSTAGKYRM